MKIYLVRHGETYWNALRKMQGQVNIPLNDRGKEQAKQAAKHLKDVEIDICYTSPLVRARQTAEIILEGRDVPIIDVPLLIEQSYGISDVESQEIGFSNPKSLLYNFMHHPDQYIPDIGGESFEDLTKRAARFIEEWLLPAGENYKSILVSAHGAILCGMLNTILGIPIAEFWKWEFDNCMVRELTLEGGIILPTVKTIGEW